MKIVCIARNYAEHAAEMGAPRYERTSLEAATPAFFLKPATALLTDGAAFAYPSFSRRVEHEAELVVRIARGGHNIAEAEACRCYDAVTLGIDFTARDLQQEAKAKGLPWTLSKGFDGSAPVGEFIPLAALGEGVQALSFSLLRNGRIVQQGTTADMLCPIDRMIAHVSRYITLEAGDLLFTGTPSGVGPVERGDTLTGILMQREVLHCKVL